MAIRPAGQKCSWCDKPATKWLMHQAFCDKCGKKFTDLHAAFNSKGPKR